MINYEVTYLYSKEDNFDKKLSEFLKNGINNYNNKLLGSNAIDGTFFLCNRKNLSKSKITLDK